MNASFLWISSEAPNIEDPNKWNLIRAYRNELLANCDWTQLADTSLPYEEKTAWTAYRQTLRNLPQNYTNPDDVLFPNKPDINI